MNKLLKVSILAMTIFIASMSPKLTINATLVPQPIAPVITTKPNDIGWEGYTESPELKFYVDETETNNTGNIIDPVDGNRIFKNFLNAIDYRKKYYPDQSVEINLRSNVTNVANFGDRLTNVLVVGNGYSFMRISGNVTRAFETSRLVTNVEFRNVNFDGGALTFGSGIVFEGAVGHNRIKFTNVAININVEAKPQANGNIAPPQVISFFDASSVTFDHVDMSGSTCVNSPGYQWPIQFYSKCNNFDLSGLTSMPINDSGKPVAIAFWNNSSSYGPDTEPYNIYTPEFPYLLTYRSERGHRTLAFENQDDAKAFAKDNTMLYPQYIDLIAGGVVIGEPARECIINLSKNSFIINSAATLENIVKFINSSGHGPDHIAEIIDPDDTVISIGDEGSCTFNVIDTANTSYVFDFLEAKKDSDYILASSDESVISSASLSIGNDNNTISFYGIGVGKTVLSLKTTEGTTVSSFGVTVLNNNTLPQESTISELPSTGDDNSKALLIIFALSAMSLILFYITKKLKD